MFGERAIQQFTDLAQRWMSAYRRVFLVYVAYKVGGDWKLSYAGAAFQADPFPRGVLTEIKVETACCRAGRVWFDCASTDLNKLVELLTRGAIELDGQQIAIGSPNVQDSVQFFSDVPPTIPSQNARVPTLVVSSNAGANFSGLDLADLESELRGADSPYDGVDDLFTTLGVPAGTRTSAPRVEIYLQLPVILALPDSHISNSNAKLKLLTSPTASTERIVLGLRIPRQGQDTERSSIPGSRVTWVKGEMWLEGNIAVPMGSAIDAQCFVKYADEHVSRWWLTDPSQSANFRTIIQRFFDSDDRKLKKLLFPPKTESRDLEKGLGLLLGILGFGVLSYGEKESFQEGPDLVAITPGTRILVVECAIDLPDAQGKIAKLKARTQKITEALQSKHFGYLEVMPLLATVVTRSELEANGEFFAKSKIAIAGRENLEELLRRLDLPENPDALFQEVKRLVWPT